jgi:hypothetical protein
LEELVGLSILTTPIVIDGLTGLVVVVVSSIPVRATELRRVVVNAGEAMIG